MDRALARLQTVHWTMSCFSPAAVYGGAQSHQGNFRSADSGEESAYHAMSHHSHPWPCSYGRGHSHEKWAHETLCPPAPPPPS